MFKGWKMMALLGLWLASSVWSAQPVLIDVRTAAEFEAGHVEGAHWVEYQQIAAGVQAMDLDKDEPIYLYCRSGNRANMAERSLRHLGYQQVINLGSQAQAEAWQQSKSNRAESVPLQGSSH